MKQTPRNLFVFGTLALTALAASGGCSSNDGPALGGGTSSFGGSSTAGTFGAAGTGGTGVASGGTGTATAGTFGTGTAGTFGTGTAGTFGTGTAGTFGTGTAGTGGTAAGGTGAGGTAAGGTAAGGTAAGGTGTGTGITDFPATCPAPSATAHGATALTRTCWGAKANECAKTADNMNPPTQAIDAAGATTRFASGAEMLTSLAFTFDIDLGSAVMVNGVTVTSEPAKTDYAPGLEVDVSTDGTTFTPVACGPGAVSTDFSFTPVNARYVRFIQHGTAPSWWSIWDLNVYSTTGDTCAGGGTQTNTCTTPHT